jgi:hypothetical protein
MKALMLNPLSELSSFFDDYEIESMHSYEVDDSEIEENTYDGCVDDCLAEMEIAQKDQVAMEFHE